MVLDGLIVGTIGTDGQDKETASAPVNGEKAEMDLSRSSALAQHRSTANVAQEVTIRQVAPLVMVLTGATFLNVNYISPPTSLPFAMYFYLMITDHLSSIRCDHSA